MEIDAEFQESIYTADKAREAGFSEELIAKIWPESVEQKESLVKRLASGIAQTIGEVLGIANPPHTEQKAVSYSVQPFHSGFGKDEASKWSFSADDGNAILEKGGWPMYKRAHLVVDTSEGNTPENKGAYTYPVAKLKDGEMTYYLRAAQSVYAGLRGGARGAKLPEATNERVLSTVKKIYDAFGRDTEEMGLKAGGGFVTLKDGRVIFMGGPSSGSGRASGSSGLPQPVENPRIDTRRPTYESVDDIKTVLENSVVDGPNGQLGAEMFIEGKGWYPLKVSGTIGESTAKSREERISDALRAIDIAQSKNGSLVMFTYETGEGFERNEVTLDLQPTGNKEQSIEDKLYRLRLAFQSQFADEDRPDNVMAPYITEIYIGFVVVEDDAKLYKVAYTQTQDGWDFVPREEWVAVERQVNFIPLDGGAAMSGEKAGRFVTIEGRPVFIGGAATGGGSGSGVTREGLELAAAVNAARNMGMPQDVYMYATDPKDVGMATVSMLVQSGMSEEDAFDTWEGEHTMWREDVGLIPKPEPTPARPERETRVNLVTQTQLDAEQRRAKVGLIDDYSKVGSTFNADKTMQEFGLPASSEPALYGYFRGLYTLDEVLEMLPETEGLSEFLWPGSTSGKSIDFKSNRAFAFKTKSGDLWWFQWTTNGFKDREGEIFTTKALEDYVERHRGEDVKGEFWYRHIPGTKFGTVKWQAMVGRFLAQAGPFDDTDVGRSFKEFFQEFPESHPTIAPEGWGTSHGYFYNHEDRKDGVYDWLEIKESTVLPSSAASNPWSPAPRIIRSVKMNEQEKKDLLAIGGQDFVDLILKKGEGATKDLEEKGIAHKDYADFAARIMAVADMVTDEAAKAELTAIAQEMSEYGAMEEEAGAMLEEEAGGEEFAMASSEGKGLTVEGLGSVLSEMVKTFRAEIEQSRKDTIDEVAAALKPLSSAVANLTVSDGEKIKQAMEQTPAASLMQIVESAIGAKDAEVKEGDPILKAATPKKAPVPQRGDNGLYGLPSFINDMINPQQ